MNDSPKNPNTPLRGTPVRPPRRVILASHLVFTGCAHWLSNDPRGSGSTETRKDELRELGDIHHGRKRLQPPRDELKNFHRAAEDRLQHEGLPRQNWWFVKPYAP